MELCKHEAEVNRTIFCPPNWGNEKEEAATLVVWELCHECLLRPCFAAEKQFEMFEFACELKWADPESEDWGGNDAIAWKTMKHAESLMAEVFGARCVRRVGLPWCAEKAIRNKCPLDEHPHPDDELAQVAEDAELLCLPL